MSQNAPDRVFSNDSESALNHETRVRKAVNLVVVFAPVLGLVAAAVFLWERLIGPVQLSLFAGGYVLCGLGITVGFHRLLTHRSFKTYPAVRYTLAVLGTLALEGSPIQWVANHRKHHAFADEEGDPHSPHEAGPGVLGALKGLWHAHVGWMFINASAADRERFAPDLGADRGMRAIDHVQLPLAAGGLLLPFGLGYALTGSLVGALSALVWGGLVRIFLLHHVTFAINSVCHFFGRRRFDTKDHSGNVFWLSLASFGESWHHNHHAFPTSAFHGLRRRELDPGGLFISLLERLGLAWDVVRISPERQGAAALAGASAAKP